MRELRGDQPRAFEALKTFLDREKGGMFLLSGHAGTGKTYLMFDIYWYISTLCTASKSVIFTAPTNKAVRVMKTNINNEQVSVVTTHRALGMKENITDAGALTFVPDTTQEALAARYNAVVVDEASMIDDSLFWPLLSLSEAGKKIIFVGDAYQIPPVNYEYALPFEVDIQKEHNIEVFTMEEIIRQKQGNPIIELAQHIRNNIYSRKLEISREEHNCEEGSIAYIPARQVSAFLKETILPMYKSEAYKNSLDYVKVIAWTNDTVNRYNRAIRNYIFGEKLGMIIPGDNLIADSPIFERDKKTIAIITNSEMTVTGVELDVEKIGDDCLIKYYKAHVRVFDNPRYNQYVLRIVHEESLKNYGELLKLQANMARSYPKGSHIAKTAWRDYYDFIKSWAQVKYSYCITAHKAQGSTYNTACVLEYDIRKNPLEYERNRIMYTSFTRPSKRLYVIH